MANFIPDGRSFFPAVLGGGIDRPNISKIVINFNLVNAIFEAGNAPMSNMLLVAGLNQSPKYPKLTPIILQKAELPDPSTDEILNLKWKIRNFNYHENPADVPSIKHGARFELQPLAMQAIRAGMLHIALTEGNFEDANIAVKSISDERIADYALSKIDLMFFSLADVYASSDELTPRIASEGGFDETVLSALLDRFEVDNLLIKKFSDSIYRSVWSYLRIGGDISGDWGKLARADQNIYMILSQQNLPIYEDNNQVELSFE